MTTKIIKAGFPAVVLMSSGVLAWSMEELPDTPPKSTNETALDAEAEKFVGNWTSLPCESRGYPRILIVSADGTFGATDWIKSGNAQGAAYTRPSTAEHKGTWRLRNPALIELSLTTPGTRGVVPMPAAIGFDVQTGQLHEATPDAPEMCKYNRSGTGQSPDPAGLGPASACHDAVQGVIAWDYQGNKSWRADNVARLCAGAGETTEPARCFNTAMHRAVDRGDNSPWQWSQAVDLCSGTSDADATLRCFTHKISDGITWSDAVKVCNAGVRVDE